MGLDFLRDNGARRMAAYDPQPPLWDAPTDEADVPEEVTLDYEIDRASWTARVVTQPPGWDPLDWPERPVRFIDGKDVGQTIAWLRAPGGYPVPVRLSEIGGVAVRVADGLCRRESASVERVVSMVVDPFPWDEIESFAAALQVNGFHLLPATPPGPNRKPSFDFEEMRKAAQNRSNTEMAVLEEAALAQDHLTPTIVDGRLEPRSGGFDQSRSPVVGVVKSHSKNYLHALGLQLLYQLRPGERTPLFEITGKLPVVSWYLRLVGDGGGMPNWGIVRVEVPRSRLARRIRAEQYAYADRLSHLLCAYRCRDATYARAPVSLHPVVRAEALLGALFTPGSILASRFYRLCDL